MLLFLYHSSEELYIRYDLIKTYFSLHNLYISKPYRHTDTHLPGLHGKLGVQHTSWDTELLEEELEAVAAFHGAHEHQGLAPHQPQLEECVDEQELVLLVTLDAVLLQLTAVRQLGALQLQGHLEQQSRNCSHTHHYPGT